MLDKLHEAEARLAAANEAFDLVAADIDAPLSHVTLAEAQAQIEAAELEIRAIRSLMRTTDARRKKELLAAAKQRREQIHAEFSKILAERDAAAVAVEETISAAVTAFRRLLGTNDRLLRQFADNGVVPPNAVELRSPVASVAHELYRQSAHPPVGGGKREVTVPSFPGSVSPDHRLTGQPDLITSLSHSVAQSNAYLAEFLVAEFSKSIVLDDTQMPGLQETLHAVEPVAAPAPQRPPSQSQPHPHRADDWLAGVDDGLTTIVKRRH